MAKLSLAPAQQKQILFGVLGLIGLYGWMSFFLLPHRRSLQEGRAQLQELQWQVEQTRQGLAQQSAMEEEIKRLTSQYQLPVQPKPPEQQLPDLLEEISQTARKFQVRILGGKPNADVNKLTPGPSGYLELQILIAASGGYHQIGAFLNAVEESDHLLRVREMSVLPNPEQITQHTAVLLFQVYLVPSRPSGEKG